MLLVIYFDIFKKDLIDRLKENKIYHDTVKYDDVESYLKTHSIPKIVILTGSKKRILKKNEFPQIDKLLKKNVKIIGICFGFHYLAFKTGATIVECQNFKGRRLSEFGEKLFFNHHDRVIKLSKQWKVIAKINDFINIAVTERCIGFQFHPEKDSLYFNRYVLPCIK